MPHTKPINVPTGICSCPTGNGLSSLGLPSDFHFHDRQRLRNLLVYEVGQAELRLWHAVCSTSGARELEPSFNTRCSCQHSRLGGIVVCRQPRVKRDQAALPSLEYFACFRLFDIIASTRHARSAHTAEGFGPRFAWMVLANPSNAETYRTISIHPWSVSGVRNGDDLSSLRSSCSASFQNSSSRPSGLPFFSQRSGCLRKLFASAELKPKQIDSLHGN